MTLIDGKATAATIKKEIAAEVNEIIPEEEISEEQMRQTIVSLYFYNEATQSLVPEGR